jgi:nucleoid-associated protein Lsr2
MAQKVVLIDDLDGSEGEETLRYTVDGQEYEIDLSGKNAAKFRSDLQVYIDKSREVTPQPVITLRPTRRRGASGSGRDDIAQVRAWAEAQGIPVNPRGRIKKETLDRYDAEHSKARSFDRPVTTLGDTNGGTRS